MDYNDHVANIEKQIREHHHHGATTMRNDTPSMLYGPTACEAARNELVSLDIEIDRLQVRRKAALLRMQRFANSTMLEAERLATASEPFQRYLLT